jgi:hypothetical protein
MWGWRWLEFGVAETARGRPRHVVVGGGSGEEDGLAIYGEDPCSPDHRTSGSVQTPAADPSRLAPSRSRYGSTGKVGL